MLFLFRCSFITIMITVVYPPNLILVLLLASKHLVGIFFVYVCSRHLRTVRPCLYDSLLVTLSLYLCEAGVQTWSNSSCLLRVLLPVLINLSYSLVMLIKTNSVPQLYLPMFYYWFYCAISWFMNSIWLSKDMLTWQIVVQHSPNTYNFGFQIFKLSDVTQCYLMF